MLPYIKIVVIIMKSTYHLYIWRDSGKEVKQFIVVNCIGTPKLFCKFIDAWKNDNYWNLHSLLLKTHFWQMNLSDLKISIKLPFSLEWTNKSNCLSSFSESFLSLSQPNDCCFSLCTLVASFAEKKKKALYLGNKRHLARIVNDLICFSPPFIVTVH